MTSSDKRRAWSSMVISAGIAIMLAFEANYWGAMGWFLVAVGISCDLLDPTVQPPKQE